MTTRICPGPGKTGTSMPADAAIRSVIHRIISSKRSTRPERSRNFIPGLPNVPPSSYQNHFSYLPPIGRTWARFRRPSSPIERPRVRSNDLEVEQTHDRGGEEMEQTHERCGGGTLTTAVAWGTVTIAMEEKPSWRQWLEEQSRRQWRRWGSRLWRRPAVGEPAVEETDFGG
ncbi:hypothetical protein E3N88_36611 [Mikania micrantha]|uniref:Uncharacterized protein n=1 Tax=Mikania micrantha TaxID=192012 RepID=A0A5N6M4R2_9ASTR|nr:hypothetical protein E3N88_36611 [Mikania micrantha]